MRCIVGARLKHRNKNSTEGKTLNLLNIFRLCRVLLSNYGDIVASFPLITSAYMVPTFFGRVNWVWTRCCIMVRGELLFTLSQKRCSFQQCINFWGFQIYSQLLLTAINEMFVYWRKILGFVWWFIHPAFRIQFTILLLKNQSHVSWI